MEELRDPSLDDPEHSKPDRPDNVLSEFRQLSSRRVDLVGDYAGSELFVIDGDSLLLRCFDDIHLDFGHGFQLLHAVYLVERFLQNLQQRKCTFHIAFFHCNTMLCIPAGAQEDQRPKYLLARAVIIRHLSSSLRSSSSGTSIHVFESWTSSSFARYVSATLPYFLMAHDGAKSANEMQKLDLRSMIVHLIENGYNIALINEMQWQDTKIMASVLEPRKGSTARHALDKGSDCKMYVNDSTLDVATHLKRLQEAGTDFNERELLAIVAVTELIESPPSDLEHRGCLDLCTKFLQHQALITHLPLSARRYADTAVPRNQQQFLRVLTSLSTSILSHTSWEHEMSAMKISCTVADYVDGRLFSLVTTNEIEMDAQTDETFARLLAAVRFLAGGTISPRTSGVHCGENQMKTGQYEEDVEYKSRKLYLIPFSNPVFDKHFENIRIEVETHKFDDRMLNVVHRFQDITHWHNARKPLIQKGPLVPTDGWQAKRAATRNQRFMAEMQKYAASLTNAVGKALEPETIVVRSEKLGKTNQAKLVNLEMEAPDSHSTSVKYKSLAVPKMDKKTMAKNAQKAQFTAQRLSSQAAKAAASADLTLAAFHTKLKTIETISDPQARYTQAQVYLGHLKRSVAHGATGVECELYMVSCLASHWTQLSRAKSVTKSHSVAALVWHHLSNVSLRPSLSKSNVTFMKSIIDAMDLPALCTTPESSLQRRLSFTPFVPVKAPLSTSLNGREFLLTYCGPYLERSFDSKPDPRVEFSPDAWQRRVLDSIDANQSIFVVAPTSAGKTFISFYAMRQVLEADDDGVLVYVAPTKALVNQIAAEVQARYSKSFKHPGKSVWAIHTRDYRVNSPSGCQILVTVPHILQIMLMSPSNAATWSTRIKRIIFDEVHSIGQADDGVVWEQLLLMSPCPIIALSATVGNPTEFASWLTSTQNSIGVPLETVMHPHRYSDLRKFFYSPPTEFCFQGLSEKTMFDDIGLDGLIGLDYIHPIATLIDRSRRLPEDLALEPRDCLYLWQAMKKVGNEHYKVSEALNPIKALPESFRKEDVLIWEKSLKDLLQRWLDDPDSPFEKLVQVLEKVSVHKKHESSDGLTTGNHALSTKDGVPDHPGKPVLPLLCQLHERDALPAMIFNYDRHGCEKICKGLLDELESAEKNQVKSGPKWARKLDEWERWKVTKATSDANQLKTNDKKKSSRQKGKGKEDDEKLSRSSVQQDVASVEVSKWQLFDPDSPEKGYHFADYTRMQASELKEMLTDLEGRDVNSKLITALGRGIGVHHAGMNRKYRQVVEMLFRKRFLGVVVATGTLALGINMPCKTVVFSGDSIYLTALNYRQCAGRAGRRGFDLLGNVVFQGIPKQKVYRLISSRLPSLNGHFPIPTSFVLRLFILLTESKNSDYAVTAIDSVLSQPRLYMGGSNFKDQTMHHLRFSIEYLRRQNLLSRDGAPLNFAGLVSHLYYTENSSFAFHALMKEGFFGGLCADIHTDEEATLLALMLVMSHLFGRVACRWSDLEFYNEVVKPSSSVVFLPPLPKKASQILQEHNKETQAVFETYVRTFVDQHISSDDNILPFTGIKCGGDKLVDSVPSLPPVRVRSSFVALSGAGDAFSSIHDLCSTVRSGVFLEEAVIPYVQISPEDTNVPLNAWLLDFFKHGDVVALEKANGIRRSDVWFYLNDFSLVLATIVTSLTNYLRPGPGGDVDFDVLNLQGEMDTLEEAHDDALASAAEGNSSGQQPQHERYEGTKVESKGRTQSVSSYTKLKKQRSTKINDSWEDEDDSDDNGIRLEDARASRKTYPSESSTASSAYNLSSATDEAESRTSANTSTEHTGGMVNVLVAFTKLQAAFNKKFKAMWA